MSHFTDEQARDRRVRARSLATQTEFLQERVRTRARRLRDLADELDRTAKRMGTIGTPEYRGAEIANSQSYLVSTIVHDTLGAVPNLGLAELINAASEIDLQRAELERLP